MRLWRLKACLLSIYRLQEALHDPVHIAGVNLVFYRPRVSLCLGEYQVQFVDSADERRRDEKGFA